jgi:beta-galactosidase
MTMKRTATFAGLAVWFSFLLHCVTVSGRTVLSFDADWRFLKADATNAESIQFDDSTWRRLDVPHDWSIEGPFEQTNKAGGAGAFLPSGVAWYRKHFTLPKGDSNVCVSVEFDGVMANSDVWINGFHLGHRPYGYVSFSYELKGHLNPGGDNVLAVRADTSEQPASRWGAGAGIYRHVRLVMTGPVHIAQWGQFVSTPEVSEKHATVEVVINVTSESKLPPQMTVRSEVLSPTGKIVGTAETAAVVANAYGAEFGHGITVTNPRLWDLADGQLYRVVSEVRAGGKTLDAQTNAFGIRDFHFDAATGFWLNGKNFKIKGVCLHADGSAFGAAVPLSVWEERLKTLRTLGVNAIRTAHNPPAQEFLDLCDRMGFLVMDEFFDCWTVGKNSYDYHLYFKDWSQRDERDTILRDRNHPSIILYSVGNEIHDTPNAELAKGILEGLVKVAHETDPTRPVTQALFRPNVSHDYEDGLADMLDVVGQNYREKEILAAHEQKPTRKIIGTENTHDRNQWVAMRDNPPYAGQFLWSGIDYLGESRRWPVFAAGSGLLDRTGTPKPMGFERQSWWSDKPMVFITRRISRTGASPTDPGFETAQQDVLRRPHVLFADWTPRNLEPHEENVEIYSNCKEVELFLNGKSLGAKPLNTDATPRNWRVPFAPGVIKAVARDERGRVVARDELKTAGEAKKIRLSTSREKIGDNWDEVCRVTAEVTDEHGVVVPFATELIKFGVTGPGRIAAVDSADNASHEMFQDNERHAFEGQCVAYIKGTEASGRIRVTASSDLLKGDSVVVEVLK